MKKIGIILITIFSIIAVQAKADIVETTSGSVYKGTITKMDEHELFIKTPTGIVRVPRPKIKAFQSEPPPGTSANSGANLSSMSSATQKKTAGTLGESAKEALRGLKKLEARCESGISYRDYGPALGEAKFEVNLFLESQEAKENPELAKAISKVINHYATVQTVWEQKFDGKYAELRFTPDSVMGRIILEDYPELNKDYKIGGALMTTGDLTVIMIDVTLSHIWVEASKELKIATEIFSK